MTMSASVWQLPRTPCCLYRVRPHQDASVSLSRAVFGQLSVSRHEYIPSAVVVGRSSAGERRTAEALRLLPSPSARAVRPSAASARSERQARTHEHRAKLLAATAAASLQPRRQGFFSSRRRIAVSSSAPGRNTSFLVEAEHCPFPGSETLVPSHMGRKVDSKASSKHCGNWASTVRPNPSIEGTASGLRPPAAPHVTR